MYDLPALLEGQRDALRATVLAGEPGPIRDAKIKITSRCNLRCRMCHYWRNVRERALDTSRWKTVLDELVAASCRKIHVSGGEPFLRRDLLDILEHGAAAGLKVNLTTNGTLLDKEQARRMGRGGINAVSVSVDAATAGKHDTIRGREGSFKQSLRALRWLKRFQRRGKPKLRINVVLMRDNYKTLPDLLRLAGELGVDDVVPMPVDESFDGHQKLKRRQIEHYNQAIASQVLELRQRYGFDTSPDRVFPFGTTDRDIKHSKRGDYARGYHQRQLCLAPWLHTFIAWDGNVYLCCMTTEMMDPLGNVAEHSVASVFQGGRYARARRRFLAARPTPQCHRCDLFARDNRLLSEALELPAMKPAARRHLPLVSSGGLA